MSILACISLIIVDSLVIVDNLLLTDVSTITRGDCIYIFSSGGSCQIVSGNRKNLLLKNWGWGWGGGLGH